MEAMMHVRQLACSIACALVLALPAAQAQEQPIRIVFPFVAGGSGDGLSRLMADKLRAALNRPVIVENRTGAAGRLGVLAVRNAPPDGGTLLITPIAPLAVYQHVYRASTTIRSGTLWRCRSLRPSTSRWRSRRRFRPPR
jgi:tripartite-type tricarboxylate transporter receptor subunit TctC